MSPDNPLLAHPALYVVATPLGNAQDITLRALAVLRAVDVIAAEDTRHSQRLFDLHNIHVRTLPLHEHNEQEGATQILRLLEQGKQVALVSDAGTPAISDPGARLVFRVQEAGFPVVPLPGPCAAITALSASGLACTQFHFVGFLPPKSAARCSAIDSLREMPSILVFYEAPHRITECIADIAATLEPEREIVFCRELTKQFEQIARMPIEKAPAWLAADPNRQRGEFVLLVGVAKQKSALSALAQKVLGLLLKEGLPVKTAAKLAAEISGEAKNALYEEALKIKNA